MTYRFYPAKEEFPYRVTIDNYLEWTQHQEISAWCRKHFGDDTHMFRWRHCLAGTPSRADPEFSTWLFMDEEAAMQFKLTWG